jgi:CDGSH-type Zn-finger protein
MTSAARPPFHHPQTNRIDLFMATPVRASDTPFAVAVEQGKDYWWCACGKSSKQPFCDGSHRAEGVHTPVKYTAVESTTVYFCGCKASGQKPLCDGTHNRKV